MKLIQPYRCRLLRRNCSSNGATESQEMEIIAANTQIITVETDMIRKKTLTIALVGRPNTGKSTLFNKLTGSNNAIVSAVPGTTRDRKQEKGRLAGLPLVVMDTGGLDDRGAISIQIQDQVQLALQSADVVIFMLDSKTGVTSLDDYFAKWLRKKLGQIEKSEAQKLININATISKEDLEAGAISDSVRAATRSQDRSAKEIIVVANKTEGAHLSAKVLDYLCLRCWIYMVYIGHIDKIMKPFSML
jgi:small GTP-binding protein